MLRLGIFGYPVAHSKSPRMHAAAAEALGLEIDYERFEVAPDELDAVVEEKHEAEIDGYNVTVPHKQAILRCLDDVKASARAIGAVNTVVRTDERYVGHNTDAGGLVRALEDASVELEDARVVVLGAGGAARAAVVGLGAADVSEVTVLARRPARARALAEALADAVECAVDSAALSEAERHFGSADLVIQATSATLRSNPQAKGFAHALPFEALPSDATVFDMVYDPRQTTVLERAGARGLRTVDGLGMLVHQGALAFELWTGKAPSVDVMRKALDED